MHFPPLSAQQFWVEYRRYFLPFMTKNATTLFQLLNIRRPIVEIIRPNRFRAAAARRRRRRNVRVFGRQRLDARQWRRRETAIDERRIGQFEFGARTHGPQACVWSQFNGWKQ